MSKFNRITSKFKQITMRAASGTSPVTGETTASGRTYEGAPGYARDAKSELFLLAVTNLVGENAFYEDGGQRDNRFIELVHTVAVADPDWMLGMVTWLRADANMRSAALVAAAEAVKARLDASGAGGVEPGADPQSGDGVRNRQFIDAVLLRADEPGELLAYWTSRYGRAIPKPVKRGVGDAVRRLYTERNLLKYDTKAHGFRFADVIELTHPEPAADRPWQGDLFRHAIDRRHGRDDRLPECLGMLRRNASLRERAGDDPSALLDPEALRAAGMTWEDVLSFAGSTVDKARLWSALIPSMGYAALLRNLRNFDQAGVPDTTAGAVAAKLADPAEVARSRQLPMRFLSAHRAAPSLRWAYPLEQALGHCLANVPALPGRTLILVDTSSSMDGPFAANGSLRRWDAATVFGIALGQRCANADVVSFSSTARYWGDPHGARTKAFPLSRGESLLRAVDRWKSGGWFLGGGTATAAAIRRHYAAHDRVVLLTDEQAGSDPTEVAASVPRDRMLVTFNLAGYRHGHGPSGDPNRVTIGGLTDAGFRMLPMLEAGRNADWPWAKES